MFASVYPEHVRLVTNGLQEVLEDTGFDGIIIGSGRLRSKTRFDDQEWPYQPSPFFRWVTPLAWPDCAVVMSRTGAPTLWAIERSSFWEAAPVADWSLIESGLEVERVESMESLRSLSGRWAIVAEDEFDHRPSNAELNPEMVLRGLEDLRVHKTDYEIQAMTVASRIGAMGHRAAGRAFADGDRSELLIHLRYLEATGQDDHETPYKNIVALGRHAATLHHVTYGTQPEARSMLIDAGAMSVGYCSDITRTHVSGGNGEDVALFRQLVSDVEALQLGLIDSIRVGMNYESLHDRAHELLARALVDLQLLRVSEEAAVETGLTRKFFPHGLGHSIGVTTHDVGCRRRSPAARNPFLRNTRDIAPRQVFTVEPGVYFIDALLNEIRRDMPHAVDWNVVEVLKPFGGVRIEDNVVVLEPTEQGSPVRNLTREAFASLRAAGRDQCDTMNEAQ
ncbi:MAG: Xaa-Pro dipeptidase [Myxococcota bacterium]